MRFGLISGLLLMLCACASAPSNKAPERTPVPAKRTAAHAARLAAKEADYMSQLQNMLSRTLNGTSLTMKRKGNAVVLTMPGSAAFAKNSYNMAPKAAEELKKIAPVLRYYEKTRITVVGHTAKDPDVKDTTNKLLSRKRAEKAVSVLTASGLKADRFQSEGKGADEPVAKNDTAAGRTKNNRLEIVLTPLLR